ncbi:MAG: DMT family transporter [Thiopseudomonas sp.]
MYYWIMLALAVLAEVASTIGMKYAATHSPLLGYAFMAVMISFSMYAFSRAVMHIPLAVSYAVWEGAGLFLIAMAGMLLFGEHLSTGQLLAVGLMMFGLLLVTFDQGPDKDTQPAGQGRVEA